MLIIDDRLLCNTLRTVQVSSQIVSGVGGMATLFLTVKFLNFGTPEKFAVIYLKFKQRGQSLRVFRLTDANGITNSEDPDQTANLGAVWSGSALFAQTYLSENLGSLQYSFKY